MHYVAFALRDLIPALPDFRGYQLASLPIWLVPVLWMATLLSLMVWHELRKLEKLRDHRASVWPYGRL
jgi:hypothetical protein